VRVAGIQPGYLPWLGYFDQMRRVDAFIVADEMQFSSGGWAHRNRIRGPQGVHWLTLPARPVRGQAIGEVTLDPAVAWAERHLETLRHFYARSPFAAELLGALAATIDAGATRLVEATMPVIRFLAARFGITTPLVVSSEAGLEARYRAEFPRDGSPTHRIIAFLHALGARELLEGESGQTYLDVPLCEAHGIRVTFHRYTHPTYPQLHEPFVSHLSAIDLLLCCGEREARRVLEDVP
jgi:WbqC-like protein